MKVEIAKANGFEIDPNKKYLIIFEGAEGKITRHQFVQIRDKLKTQMADCFVLATQEGVTVKVVEVEA